MAVKFTLRKRTSLVDRTKLSHDALDLYEKIQLLDAIESGLPLEEAVKFVGLTRYRLGQFMSDPAFDELIQSCATACELQHLKNINMAGRLGQWQASAWALEKLNPERYGRKDTVRHEYEFKISTFMNLVLEIVNAADPKIKLAILNKLKNINPDEAALSADSLNKGNENLIEYIQVPKSMVA